MATGPLTQHANKGQDACTCNAWRCACEAVNDYDLGANLRRQILDDMERGLASDGRRLQALVGDFCGDEKAIQTVCDARPEIISHNMETVKRMHPAVRPQARYERSLAVLKQFKAAGLVTKTGIMVGIGEHDDEVLELMDDVQAASQADVLTVGQYLQPTRNHLPIHRWVHPDQFAMFKQQALTRGFKVCESGPLVRSSYHADEQADMLSLIKR